MKTSQMDNIYRALEGVSSDTGAGIDIVKLSGEEDFAMFCTRMEQGRYVSAHFHDSGTEIYHIIKGEGMMCTGYPDANGDIDWSNPFSVSEGDIITVQPGEAHQIENDSDNDLIIVFVCSPSHLGSDREMVEGILGR